MIVVASFQMIPSTKELLFSSAAQKSHPWSSTKRDPWSAKGNTCRQTEGFCFCFVLAVWVIAAVTVIRWITAGSWLPQRHKMSEQSREQSWSSSRCSARLTRAALAALADVLPYGRDWDARACWCCCSRCSQMCCGKQIHRGCDPELPACRQPVLLE